MRAASQKGQRVANDFTVLKKTYTRSLSRVYPPLPPGGNDRSGESRPRLVPFIRTSAALLPPADTVSKRHGTRGKEKIEHVLTPQKSQREKERERDDDRSARRKMPSYLMPSPPVAFSAVGRPSVAAPCEKKTNPRPSVRPAAPAATARGWRLAAAAGSGRREGLVWKYGGGGGGGKGEREKGEEEGLIIYLCQTAAAAAAKGGGERETPKSMAPRMAAWSVGGGAGFRKLGCHSPPFPFPPSHLLTAFLPSRRWRMSTHGTAEWSKRGEWEGSVEKRKGEQVLHVAPELETIFDKRCH